MAEIFDIKLDDFTPQMWNELFKLSNQLVNYGSSLSLVAGDLKSASYKEGSTGWKLTSAGDFEANNGLFRGDILAGTITIGANSWHVDSSGNMWWGSSSNFSGATYKISSSGVANLSGIVAGSVAAENITGSVMTGKVVRTGTAGNNRLEMLDQTNLNLNWINSSDISKGVIGYTFASDILYLSAPQIQITSSSASTNVNSDLYVSGNFTATGSKSFIIDHPTKEGYKLQYVCPEFPEVLAMCRGQGEVILPDHFKAITVENSIQIIKDKDNGNWIATGVRNGYENFQCEILN